MLFATDSQKQCEENAGEEEGGGMKGNSASERSSLDRTPPHPSGPD